MEKINIIDDKNIEITRSIESKISYNLDFLISQKAQLLAALNEVEELILKFNKIE